MGGTSARSPYYSGRVWTWYSSILAIKEPRCIRENRENYVNSGEPPKNHKFCHVESRVLLFLNREKCLVQSYNAETEEYTIKFMLPSNPPPKNGLKTLLLQSPSRFLITFLASCKHSPFLAYSLSSLVASTPPSLTHYFPR